MHSMSAVNSTPVGNSSSADSSTSTDNSSESNSRWLPPEESWSDADDWPSEASDPGTPLLSVCCESISSHKKHGSCCCDVCSFKRHRSRMMWAIVLVWAVPLVLAAGSTCGWWGSPRHPTREQPRGQLLLAQVIFRHGARTPLSNLYWPNTTWTHCSQHPFNASLTAAAATGHSLPQSSRDSGSRVGAGHISSSSSGFGDSSSTSSSNISTGIQLQLYDPSGAPTPPELSGGDEPVLPGGCRMGSLTDQGYQNALDLGTYLRQHYIHQHKLLPAHKLDTTLLQVESTAMQRTVTTLRGVLGGMYPNTNGTVRVAVRAHEDEIAGADWYGCPLLANLTAQLTDAQAAQDSHDPRLPELERQVRSALQLPVDAPLLWNRLRDELACMQAEGLTPAAVAAQEQLLRRIEYITTQRRAEISAPEQGDCLLGRDHQQQCKQVTALTSGRLLHLMLQNMATAARGSKNDCHELQNGHSSRQQLYAGEGLDAEELLLHRAATARRLLRPALADISGATAASSTTDSTRRKVPEQQQQQSRTVSSTAASRTASSTADSTQSAVPKQHQQPQQQQQQQQQQPKLHLFSAHDTTLLPLLTALGQHQSSWPNFTSHIAFELWVHKGKHFVRVLHDGIPLRLPLAAAAAAAKRDGLSEQPKGFFARFVSKVKGEFVSRCEAVFRAVLRLFGSHRELAFALGHTGIPEQPAYDSTAFVVSLGDFQGRVVQDYVMAPDAYATACGGPGVGRGSLHAGVGKQGLAQGY